MKTYIDCGAHNGDSVEHFLTSGSIFLPRPDAADYRIIAFEPNAASYDLSSRFRFNSKVDVVPMAVWTHNGHVEFKNDPNSLSSCVAKYTMQCYDEAYLDKPGHGERRTFQCIDLAQVVHACALDAGDYVVLKMDIESSEYAVLPHLLETGALRKIDELYVEWHNTQDPDNKRAQDMFEGAIANWNMKYFNNWP